MPTTYYEKCKKLITPYRRWADKFAVKILDGGQANAVEHMTGLSMLQRTAVIQAIIRNISKNSKDVFGIHHLLGDKTIGSLWAGYEKGGLSHAAIVSYMAEQWHHACFEKAGEQTYEVSPGLAEHLFATEVRNVTCELLRLPFLTIDIILPRSTVLTIPHEIALEASSPTPIIDRVRVEEIMVTETIDGENRAWLFAIIGSEAKDDKKQEQTDGMPNNVFYTFEQPLPDGHSIASAMDMRNQLLQDFRFKFKHPADSGWEQYFMFVMNLVLYLTYEPTKEIETYWSNKQARLLKDRVDVAKKQGKIHKAERLREELAELDPERRIYVGRHHKLLEQAETATPIGEHRHLNVRVLVSGHWRNQAHGVGRQEHKLIWIKPFWRGPPGAPISTPYRRIAT